METWFLVAITAPLLFSITNYIDSYAVTKFKIDVKALPIYVSIGAFFTFLFCYFILDGKSTFGHDSLRLFISGLLIMGGIYFYCRALQFGQMILISVLFQLIPVMGLIGSYFLFNEQPTSIQLLGVVATLVAALGISIKWGSKIIFDKTFFYMFVADLLFCSSSLIIKDLSGDQPISYILCYEALGVTAAGLLIFLFVTQSRQTFLANTKMPAGAWLFIVCNEILANVGRAMVIFAISLGPLALVLTLQSVQVFYGLVFGYVLTLLIPAYFKEEISGKGILKNVLFSILMFVGVYLIQM